MEIKTAEFQKSISRINDCPKAPFPEIAFIGRSNVGKSSLINMLCGRNELARTSANPGKTVTLNYYLINNRWHLVDLPGYGYAKRSKTLRSSWEKTLVQYLKTREQLACLCVLIDSRIPPQSNDLAFIEELGELQVPFILVFTKTDKVKASELEKNIQSFRDVLLASWEHLPAFYTTSSVNKSGKEELLHAIDEIIKTYHALSKS